MTTLFNRFVSFEVGKPGEEGFIFSELKIEFNVTKTTDSSPNPGTVKIYNLAEKTREILSQEGLVYKLRTGYSGINEQPLVKILSQGDVLDISTVRNATDQITTFKIGEGTKKLAETTVDQSFKPGVTTRQLVDSFTNTLGIAKGAIIGLKDTVFNSGYSASGKIRDRLDELMEKQDLEWSVQNDELIILPRLASSNEEAVLLTPDTGLKKAFKQKTNKPGAVNLSDVVNFEAFINPDIKIGRDIAIYSPLGKIGESAENPAFFTTRKLTFSGDNRMGNFSCVGEAI